VSAAWLPWLLLPWSEHSAHELRNAPKADPSAAYGGRRRSAIILALSGKTVTQLERFPVSEVGGHGSQPSPVSLDVAIFRAFSPPEAFLLRTRDVPSEACIVSFGKLDSADQIRFPEFPVLSYPHLPGYCPDLLNGHA
jgi:hypothetical protein